MKKLFAFLLLCPVALFAQNGFTGATGQAKLKTEVLGRIAPMGIVGDRVYFIAPDNSNTKYVFHSYVYKTMGDHVENAVSGEKGAFEKNGYVGASVIGTQPAVFTVENNNKAKTATLNYYTVDPQTLQVGAKTKLVDAKGVYDDMSFGLQQKQGIERKFETILFTRSPDKKMFYILTPQRGKVVKDDLELLVNIYAFNEKFELVWEKDMVCTATSKRDEPHINSLVADNKGNVYFKYMDYDMSIKKDNIYQQYYKFYTVNEKDEPAFVKLKNSTFRFPEYAMKARANGGLAISYMKGKEVYDIFDYDNIGVYVAAHNPAAADGLDKHAYLYDKTAVPQDVKYSNKDAKGNGVIEPRKNPFEHARYKDMFVQADGSVIVVCESFNYWPTNSIYTGYVENPMEYYDAFVFCVNPGEEKPKWIARIPKDQRIDMDAIWGTCVSMNDGKNTYVIYNDNEENLNLTGTGTYKRITISEYDKPFAILTVQKVDETGKLKQYKVTSNKEAGGRVNVGSAAVVDDKVTIIPVSYNGVTVNYVGVSLGE